MYCEVRCVSGSRGKMDNNSFSRLRSYAKTSFNANLRGVESKERSRFESRSCVLMTVGVVLVQMPTVM